jgi:1,4-dihydroxy-2-naphthoyl-CoA synthase
MLSLPAGRQGLILSTAIYPDLKIGVWRRRTYQQFHLKSFFKRVKTMRYREIELTREEGIALIYLNRPEVLNALNEPMKDELIHALREPEEDDDVRVLILTGRGRFFCAGADFSRFVEFQESDKDQLIVNTYTSS